MTIYLAGGINANLSPYLTRAYDRYVAEHGTGREFYCRKLDEVVAEDKGDFRAGDGRPLASLDFGQTTGEGAHILESFYYCNKGYTERLLPFYGKFILDSGAYTMFSFAKGQQLNWEEYIDRYADFIKRNDVRHFFELDIDKLVGYDEVRRLRKRLESKAERPCIPVWHKSRGKDDYIRICEEYDYIAVGGLVGAGGAGASVEYSKRVTKYFPWFIRTAHINHAKIHALGFTSITGLEKFHFDSVDSTSWTTGNRFGMLYHFDGKRMTVVDKREGQRFKDSRLLAINNWSEWVKYQRYAEVKL